MAMPAPPPPPPLRKHISDSKDAAQQPLPVEAPQDDVASAEDRPSIGGVRGRPSKEPRPRCSHRVSRIASPGSLADDEPGAATGAEARPVVRPSAEQFKDGPGASQPQIKRYSTSTHDYLPPPETNARFRKNYRDRNDRDGLPLSPLATPISSCASPRALRTPLPARRLSSSKSKSGKPLSSGALFYAQVVERMFEEEHPERRLSGPAGRRLTMVEVHEGIIGSPASSRSDHRIPIRSVSRSVSLGTGG
jgi:hypothetical protein